MAFDTGSPGDNAIHFTSPMPEPTSCTPARPYKCQSFTSPLAAPVVARWEAQSMAMEETHCNSPPPPPPWKVPKQCPAFRSHNFSSPMSVPVTARSVSQWTATHRTSPQRPVTERTQCAAWTSQSFSVPSIEPLTANLGPPSATTHATQAMCWFVATQASCARSQMSKVPSDDPHTARCPDQCTATHCTSCWQFSVFMHTAVSRFQSLSCETSLARARRADQSTDRHVTLLQRSPYVSTQAAVSRSQSFSNPSVEPLRARLVPQSTSTQQTRSKCPLSVATQWARSTSQS
mmetsp:Transcript_90733/g.256196  ORF Transcript_90733/g.256196 Transcript_90733/m.256196 type:complete len:290 (-) Transcript_90733:521-1390(-)